MLLENMLCFYKENEKASLVALCWCSAHVLPSVKSAVQGAQAVFWPLPLPPKYKTLFIVQSCPPRSAELNL